MNPLQKPDENAEANALKRREIVIRAKEMRLEALTSLLETAEQRFQSRRDMEWKSSLGLWSLFALASAAVVSARTWQPSAAEVWFAIGWVIALMLVYLLIWIPYLDDTFEMDADATRKLSKQIGVIAGYEIQIPKRNAGWPQPAGIHRALWCQYYVTIFFAVIFLVTLYSKYRQTHEPPQKPLTEVSIENRWKFLD